MFEFRLPDIGEGLTEAEVVEWLVDPGQALKQDQPLVRAETDKAVVDIPAPVAGVLLHQGAPAGAAVQVGQLLAVIGDPGETWSTEPSARAQRDDAPPIVGTLLEAESPGPATPPRSARPSALPITRKLARDLGVDLEAIEPTGPGGRISRQDVQRATEASGAGARSEERVRLSKIRRTIAENMSRSWREIPHVTTFGEAGATRLLETRRVLAERHRGEVSLEALFVKATLPALRALPEFNATLEGDELILKRRYDIGIAVDTPKGLLVPVVKGADGLDPLALSDEVARLSVGARSRSLTPAELTGATFTISNIGAVSGGHGTPIIPYGTTAIISFGRAAEKPVVRNGEVVVASMLPISLSYDHRVIDGALGRRFLAAVIHELEEAPFDQEGDRS